jgi:uncharacterized membrane protein
MQADARRIMLEMRQPACLMHVADTLGDRCERAAAALVHHGRLTFRQLVAVLATDARTADTNGGTQEACMSSSGSPEVDTAAVVTQLMTARLVEQAR